MEGQENKGTQWEMKAKGSDGSIIIGPVSTLKSEIVEVYELIKAVGQAVKRYTNDPKSGALLRVCQDNFKEVLDTVDWAAMQKELEGEN